MSVQAGKAAAVAWPLARAARLGVRVRRGIREPRHWRQFALFAMVGASGYVLNLTSFALLIHAGFSYRLAAVGAFLLAVTNNFTWNRRWTFGVRGPGRARHGIRFLVVSLTAFACSFVVLSLLVDVFAVAKLPAQVVAVTSATPLSFLGNRLWAFASSPD
jgi:dolichol-phosphate mannosyltransferase